MDYRIDFGNLLTPYPQANPTAAIQGASQSLHALKQERENKRQFDTNKAQQDYQFGEEQGLRNRQQAAREYEDVQDRQAKEEAIKQKAFEAFSAHYAHDPEKASQVWGPILDHLGIDYHPPEQQESELLKQDTEIRGGAPTDEAVPDSPGAPQASPSASTPDTAQPTSQATGERAPMTAGQKQIASGIDEAAGSAMKTLRPGEDAASYIARNPPKAPGLDATKEATTFQPTDTIGDNNNRTQPDLPPYQTKLDTETSDAVRMGKPPKTPKGAAAATAAAAQRIAKTPEPQPDESVKPPEEIAAGMGGPIWPQEWEAMGRPQPVVTPPAPVNPSVGPVLMDRKTGRVFAHMPPGNPHDVEQTRMAQAADGLIRDIATLDPQIMPFAKELKAQVLAGNIRDYESFAKEEDRILGMIRGQQKLDAARAHGGSGRDPTLAWDSGRKAAQDEMAQLHVPEFEEMKRAADKAMTLLAKGDLNSLNAVKYQIARINDPKGIVTAGDFNSAAAATLWEKTKDFFLGNGEMPTLSPEEISRMREVVSVLSQKAEERLQEARTQLERGAAEAPPGPFQQGYRHSLGTHIGGTKSVTGGAHTSVKDGPPL